MSYQCWDAFQTVDLCSWDFILKTIVLSLITASIIIGNCLVIAAVATYRKLRKSISNSFIASLAVADLLLGITVLPPATAKEALGYWVFGDIFCTIWLAVDVWMCTASILHLCAISFDRYLAIAYPLKYPNLMTHLRCRLICFSMWILSFIISFPPLIGWDSSGQSDAMRQKVNASVYGGHNSNDSLNIESIHQNLTCDVVAHSSIGYIAYSSLGSFFIPSFIMSAFYVKIFLLARDYMMKSKSGQIEKSSSGQFLRAHRGGQGHDITVQKINDSQGNLPHMKTSKSTEDGSLKDNPAFSCSRSLSGSSLALDGRSSREASQLHYKTHSQSRNSLVASSRVNWQQPLRKTSKTTSSSLSRETRAAKTVAIIVGAFIICWAPFFVCYILRGSQAAAVSEHVFSSFVWIGYLNSLLNPVIYACFSKDYRHAFKTLLKCELRSRISHRQSVMRYIASLYVPSESNDNPIHLVASHQQA